MNGMFMREKRKYATVGQGLFLMRNPDGKTVITNAKGESRNYDAYSDMVARLQRIELVDTDFGKKYNFNFDNGVVLSMTQDDMGTQSLINTLASIESFGELTVSAYLNKRGGTSLYVKNNGVEAKWHVAWDDQPKAVKMLDEDGNPVQIKGKDVYNSGKRVAFFDKLVTEINTRLQGAKVDETEIEIDEIPF